jgi:hypothetical protein
MAVRLMREFQRINRSMYVDIDVSCSFDSVVGSCRSPEAVAPGSLGDRSS